jgi:hypothetical protein
LQGGEETNSHTREKSLALAFDRVGFASIMERLPIASIARSICEAKHARWMSALIDNFGNSKWQCGPRCPKSNR